MNHPDMVAKLAKPGITIKEEVTPKEIYLWIMSLMLVQASTSLLDTLKKMIIYRKPLDNDKAESGLNEILTLANGLYMATVKDFIPQGELDKGKDYKRIITPNDAHILHMLTGIAGESGELLEAFFKKFSLEEEWDINNIIEEEGDSEFYHEGLRQAFKLTREQILNGNIQKLSKRYQDFQYTDKQAQDRADKVES